MDQYNFLLERALVALVSKMIEDGKLQPKIRNHREFAMYAFPLRGEKTWKNIRLGQKGKAQSLPLQDALSIADAVGMPLPELLVRAKIMIEQGWDLAVDPANANESQSTSKKTDVP